MSTITIPDLARREASGPLACYVNQGGTWVTAVRCGNEFAISVFQDGARLRTFDYLPRGAVPDGPLDAGTVTRLVREALSGTA
jgi:hypothetical protein